MGANYSKTSQAISQDISNALDAQVNSNSNCNALVRMGNINLRNCDRCQVRNMVACSSASGSNLDAAINSVTEAIMRSDDRIKTEFLPGIINASDTAQEVRQKLNNYVRTQCNANSQTHLDIALGDITLENNRDITVDNIFGGDAVSTCGTRLLTNQAIKTDDKINKQIQGSFFGLGDIGNYLFYGGISSFFLICLSCIFCIIIIILFTK